MKSTMGIAAKRALTDTLTALAVPAQPLDGVQVSYDYPPNPSRRVVYLGGFRTVVTPMSAEENLVSSEQVTIGLYIRVLRLEGDVRAADTDVEGIADAITAAMEANPDLGGSMTWMGVQSANGDYAHTPDGPESVLSMQVLVGAVLV